MLLIIIISILVILIIFNYAPYARFDDYPKARSASRKILIAFSILTLGTFLFSTFGMQLKGFYFYKLIQLILLISFLVYIATEKKAAPKIFANLLGISILFLGCVNSILYSKVGTFPLNDKMNLVASKQGLLSCGEILKLTEAKFIIFDKELMFDGSQCLHEIKKIEKIKVDSQVVEVLIYHNGKNNKENPLYYRVETQIIEDQKIYTPINSYDFKN